MIIYTAEKLSGIAMSKLIAN